MNVLIVHAHPEPESFNAAMTEIASVTLRDAGHTVVLSDLYAMRFHAASDRSSFVTVKDPDYFKPQQEEAYALEQGGFAPELEAEMQKLAACELLIFQFPLWWFGLPAILKGWVDRVFANGRFYGGGRVYETGVMRGRRAILSFTTGGPEARFTTDGPHGDVITLLRPIQRGMLYFVGFDVLRPQIGWSASRCTDAERAAMLEAWRQRVGRLFDETPMETGSF
ncbi:MAG: NAD(P)H-dependent oxidoreductase [Acetobacteraceae bacterium]